MLKVSIIFTFAIASSIAFFSASSAFLAASSFFFSASAAANFSASKSAFNAPEIPATHPTDNANPNTIAKICLEVFW